jgi:hypothetical protein
MINPIFIDVIFKEPTEETVGLFNPIEGIGIATVNTCEILSCEDKSELDMINKLKDMMENAREGTTNRILTPVGWYMESYVWPALLAKSVANKVHLPAKYTNPCDKWSKTSTCSLEKVVIQGSYMPNQMKPINLDDAVKALNITVDGIDGISEVNIYGRIFKRLKYLIAIFHSYGHYDI